MPSRLKGCYIKMFQFSFEKNGKFTKLDKNDQKGAEEFMEKKGPIILGNRM